MKQHLCEAFAKQPNAADDKHTNHGQELTGISRYGNILYIEVWSLPFSRIQHRSAALEAVTTAHDGPCLAPSGWRRETRLPGHKNSA